jgi:hypothetical protein
MSDFNPYSEIYSIVHEYLTDKGFATGTELVAHLTAEFYTRPCFVEVIKEGFTLEFDQIMKQMLEGNNVIEVEYVKPSMNYRVKSLYFPTGTSLNIRSYQLGFGSLMDLKP